MKLLILTIAMFSGLAIAHPGHGVETMAHTGSAAIAFLVFVGTIFTAVKAYQFWRSG